MKYLLSLIIVLAFVGAGALFYAWSGAYDIAATTPHWAATSSFIEILKDRSIEVHSKGIQAPNLNDAKLKEAAFPHYHEMCRLCHGAPAYAPEEFSTGLYPAPPSMTSGHIQNDLSDAEIYWIVKHGIKMTGMPAFGPTHKEDVLWGIVALAKEMPKMSPEHYRRQVEAMGLEGGMGHEHMHGRPEAEQDHDHESGEPSAHGEGIEEHH